jgi:PST family polysaccharide transporter/lipopolysaccharide exporter
MGSASHLEPRHLNSMASSLDLKQAARAGAGWVTLEVATSGLVQVTRVAILARFFVSPEEFGLVALATAALLFIGALSAMGTVQYLLFRTDARRDVISGLFWLNVISGAAFCALTMACAGPLAGLLGDARLAILVRVLSLVLLIDAVGNPLMAIFIRDFQYRFHAIAETASSLLGTALTLAIAAAGDGLWALIIGLIAQRALRMSAALWWGSRHIGFGISTAELARFLRFSGVSIAERLAGTLNERAPHLCLGWLQNAAQVGLFAVTSNLVTVPLQYFMNVALLMVTPVFARLQQEHERLSSAYFFSLELTLTIIAPAFLGLLVTAPLVVPMVLGEAWAPAVPTLQFLCLSFTFHAVYFFGAGLTLGTGRINAAFALTGMQAPAVLIASLLGARLGGAEGVAIGQAIVSVATVVPYYLFVTRRVLGPCLPSFLASFAVPIALAAAMALAVALLGILLADRSPYLSLALQIGMGVIVYAGLLLAFRPRLAREIAHIFPFSPLDRVRRGYAVAPRA